MSPDRLRPPPEERLDVPVQHVDLAETAAALRAEDHAAVSGHRQIAVFRQGPLTMLSFAFEPEGTLKEHSTQGIVTILAVRGHLRVTAGDEVFHLRGGELVGLAPHVPHSVEAMETSDMLLTICKL
jgi:quercetin dioxygenase-like cupin family protein